MIKGCVCTSVVGISNEENSQLLGYHSKVINGEC